MSDGDDFIRELFDRIGVIPRRVLPDGRVLDVLPLTYGRARLTISENERAGWYIDGW